METKAAEATGNIYEIFEPYCKWKTEEGQDIVEMDLRGFRKEQLKVQTNNKGILIVHGERPLDATKWSRFRKEIKLDKHSNPNDIHAKFSHGFLSIIMPKKAKEDAKESINKAEAQKGPVWGVNINKRRIIKVAVVMVAVVLVVAIGTQIAQLVSGYRHPLQEAANEDGVCECLDSCH